MRFLAATVVAISVMADLEAQYGERPGLIGSGSAAVDASGRSIKNPRTRAIHTADTSQVGGTAYLFEKDPFLGYQLGRNLNLREFRTRDGVFDSAVAGLGGPMPDGTTAKIAARNQTSCAACHNLPNGNAGGGPNFHKDSGFGRNTPHYFGAGLIEMLALQTRQQILNVVDLNDDGWIGVTESKMSPPTINIWTGAGTGPSPGVVSNSGWVSYGSARLSEGASGTPDLNNIIKVWYVDSNGVPVPGSTSVDGVTTFGFNFEIVVWGWGQGEGRAGLNPTNRAFYWDPAIAHSGLEAYDPQTSEDGNSDGVSDPTLAGALQFPVTHSAPDRGLIMDSLGFSRDDPDGDGVMNEISAGDLDLAEWFMLNVPQPAFAGTEGEYRTGVAHMRDLGCTVCHVATWNIQPESLGFAGDRRFFNLDVKYNARESRLEGRLERLYTKQGDSYFRNFDGFVVEGIFTDLAHHDMGERFAEVDFGGVVNTIWRTPPLWGVGSGFPWGHDGRSMTLEDVILRHGGEAQFARNNWVRANPKVRDAVLSFLQKLVLYDVESLPTDIDGDGVISSDFMVAGIDTREERFNAEWLFKVPVQIQGMVLNGLGQWVHSNAAVNLADAYGLNLPLRVDSDLDGWPDVWDAAPTVYGYKDGIN